MMIGRDGVRRNIQTLVLIGICCWGSVLCAQDKYAVLVGIEKYDPGTFENLKYSEEDATRLGEILEDYGYRTTVMTSDAESSKLQPFNADNILSAIKARANSCTKGDTLLVSLSGHGIQFIDDELLESGVKETYFCPSNADLSDKETLVPISQLIELVNSSEATRKLLLIDACRNEVISQAGQNKSTSKKIELESVHESRKSVPGGMSVLFSCSSEQFSWEANELERSVFSHFVTEYFEGNAGERFYQNGELSLDNMVAFVRKKTNDYVFENNLSNDGQNPVMRGESADWLMARIEKLDSYTNVEVDLLKRHAKLGIAEAQKDYGNVFLNEKDYTEAMRWYRKSAEQGYAKAQFNIGLLYDNGWGVGQDYQEAMRWYRKAADQGNARAQCNVGYLYESGNGVGKDSKEAMRWYRKAADQDYARAQCNVGYLYESGKGVGQDYQQTMRWYRKAAYQEYARAQYNVGVLYYNGNGVDQDYHEAMRWFRKAADQEYAFAQYSIGRCYYFGTGVGKDLFESANWFRKAADQGNTKAQSNLGNLYFFGHGVEKNYQKALNWFRKGAEQGNSSAQYSLGMMLKRGDGTPVNLNESRSWLQKSADQGFQLAIDQLSKW